MAELYTLSGNRLATEVQDKFGDAGQVQITRDMILVWINNGVRTIVASNPFLKQTAVTNLLAGQNVYNLGTAFPAARVISYSAITADGWPLKIIPWAEFQSILGKSTSDPAALAGRPEFAAEYGGTITVWPKPQTTVAGGLVLYFSAYPEEMTDLAAMLPLPDRFYNALVDYVFAQALELDENFEAAQVKLSHMSENVRAQFERENQSPTAYYGGMSLDPDDPDNWVG